MQRNYRKRRNCCCHLMLLVALLLHQISINLANDLYYNNNSNNNNYDNFETTPMDGSSNNGNSNMLSTTTKSIMQALGNANNNYSNNNINNNNNNNNNNNMPTTATTFIDSAISVQQAQQQQQQQFQQYQAQKQQQQQQQQSQQFYQQHQQNQRGGEFSLLDKEVVERLIKQWAPVVWLAPEEKFMPLGVDDFLQNVHPMDKDTKFIPGMPYGEYSQKSYLVTNAEIEELLQNNDSFIYGRNPNEYPVPVYAVVTLCNQFPIESNVISNEMQQQPMHGPAQPQPQPQPQAPPNLHNEFQQQELLLQQQQQQQLHQQLNNQQLPLHTQQQLPTHAKATFTAIASTRGPYIPITLDPRERLNETIRRSSRLYPIFQRVRRDVVVTTNNFLPPPLESSMNLMLQPQLLQDYDLAIGEQQQQPQPPAYQGDQVPNMPALQQQPSAPAIPIVGVAAVAANSNEDASAQVNNFIANLADNVKFSALPANNFEDNSISYNNNEQPAPSSTLLKSPNGNPKNNNNQNKNNNNNEANRQRKVPGFHVTYWMFYPYSQGKTMCTISLGPLGSIPFPAVYGFCLGRRKDIGSHIGDWEHMSLYFNGAAEPEAMYVSAHDAGAYYSYNRLTGSFEFKKQETRKGILQRPNFPKTVTTFNDHPVLFAAKGSHGLWTAPGKHRFVKVARLYDINGFGTPWNTWKSVDITYENLKSYGRSLVPNWLTFKGKWGNPKSKCHPFRRIGLNFCEYTDGPTGIPLKEPHFQCGLSYR